MTRKWGDDPLIQDVAGPGWAIGEDADDVVIGPLPALKNLAARFAEALAPVERVAFLKATHARGQSLDPAELDWLLRYAEERSTRDKAVLAALEGFAAGMANAVLGNGPVFDDHGGQFVDA
jgi:hypothetical protein